MLRFILGRGYCQRSVSRPWQQQSCWTALLPHFTLQWLTVVYRPCPYDEDIESIHAWLSNMAYPYDILTAACLFIIVVGATILLVLS
jgi:hypothetical protein